MLRPAMASIINIRLSPLGAELINVGAVEVKLEVGEVGGTIMFAWFLEICPRKREFLPPYWALSLLLNPLCSANIRLYPTVFMPGIELNPR